MVFTSFFFLMYLLFALYLLQAYKMSSPNHLSGVLQTFWNGRGPEYFHLFNSLVLLMLQMQNGVGFIWGQIV